MDFILKITLAYALIAYAVAAPAVDDDPEKAEEPAQYTFEYHVNNPETGDIKSQNEVREGDVVHGTYGLVEPDGSVRTVEYTADDKNGFRALVHHSGGPTSITGPAKVVAPPTADQQPEFGSAGIGEPESATNDLPDLNAELSVSPAAGGAGETATILPSAVAVTPKSLIGASSPIISSTASPFASKSAVTPSNALLQYAYLNPYYKYPHPWTLANLYKTHPAYRYPYLHPAHPAHPANPANPLSPLHLANPANPLSPLHPTHPANPLSPINRAFVSPYTAAAFNPLHPANLVNPLSPLHPAHLTNPLSPLNPAHPASPLNPLNPAHPANPLSPYSPLYNPLYHV